MKYYLGSIINFDFKNLMPLSLIFTMLVFVSCKEEVHAKKETESDLMAKIYAVQEQIMAQGNMTENEEQALLSLCSIVSHEDGLAVFTTENSVILKDVEMVPVYSGCEALSIDETRECFKNKVSTFIKREFNMNVARSLNLLEPKKVEAFFIINEEGLLTGLKVRDSDVAIQAEILRVFRKIPRMKPADQDGKNVSVLCSLVLTYGAKIEADITYIPERPE
ncbi:MAG: hypothetical protein P8N20_06440 [Flavobacteriaceae bacterium]|jgi:hypothetical protein|nr:hypothetical protein [Flavobacteriaceae bacterium]MDG2415400.1 hypothetical protein [Flavobacteriaceae bacterium]